MEHVPNLMKELLDAFFCGFAWYRRWRGGHWEYWEVQDEAFLYRDWFLVESCFQYGAPCPLDSSAVLLQKCEDW